MVKSTVPDSVDILNQNRECAKYGAASLSPKISVTAEKQEREKNVHGLPNTFFDGISNLTTKQSHKSVFENTTENINNTINNFLEIENRQEDIIEETTK